MSIVAVKITNNEIVIGADSFVSFSYDTQLKDKDIKIFEQNDLIVGCVGDAKDSSFLKMYQKTRAISRPDEESVLEFFVDFVAWVRKKDALYVLSSSFLIVVENKVFKITSTFHISEIKTFVAIGAGKDIAQTALMLGKNVKEAIEIACELSIYCEKPANIFTRKIKK